MNTYKLGTFPCMFHKYKHNKKHQNQNQNQNQNKNNNNNEYNNYYYNKLLMIFDCRYFTLITTILTIYLLIGNDIRLIFTDQGGD